MASRALGAFFALAAAAAFVVSIASSAFWAGYPVVDGKQITAKHVRIGPLGATGCNIGGDGSCESVAIAQEVQLAGYATLGTSGLAALFALLVLFAAAKVSERRRGIALASMVFALFAAGAAGAMVAIGPGIEASNHIEVPIAWGIHVFGGGVLASVIASLVTRRLEPEPLRLKPSVADIPAGKPKRGKTPQPPPELQAYMEAQARQSQSQLQAPPHRPSQSQQPARAHRPSQQALQAQPQQPHAHEQPAWQSQQPTQQPSWQSRRHPVSSPPRTKPPSARLEPVDPFGQTVSPIAQVSPLAQTASPFTEPALPDSDVAVAPHPAARDPLMRGGLSGMPPTRNGALAAAGSGTLRARELGSPRAIEGEPSRERDGGSMRGTESGSLRAKPPTAPPRSASPTRQPPATTATTRPASTTRPPPATNELRPAATTHLPPRTSTTRPPPFSASPTSASGRAKPTSAPPPLAAKPIGAPASASKPIGGPGNDSARIKPPSVIPPLAKPAAATSAKLPSILSPPKKPIVPLPAARAKTTQDDQPAGAQLASEPRAATETGTPPAPQPSAVRTSRPHMTPVPTRSPTVAHAVPPMPTTGSQPALERTDDEDQDASAEFSVRARSIGDNDARAGILAAFGAAPVVDDTDASREVDDTDASRDVADITHDRPRRRSDTDMATGKTSAVGDVTQTGLEAPMPARAKIDVALRAAINVRLPDVEPESTALTEQPAPPVVDDLVKTMQDPQTPIPTLDRKAVPVLESGDPAERVAKVPLSTAPTSLPPPKQLDAEPSGPSPACPQCEAPMSWVDEHLRFYCRACRMYF